MRGNDRPSRLSGSKQIEYILKRLTEGKTISQILDDFDGDIQLVEIWTSFLVENRLIKREDERTSRKRYAVTEDGWIWLVNTGMKQSLSPESSWWIGQA
jgi:DNA-binding PadR family transcriptional regulator